MDQISGVRRMLDRLEKRALSTRELLLDMTVNQADQDFDDVALTKGELETVESAIVSLSSELLGEEPPQELWESIHSYAMNNYDRKKEWAYNEAEYFRWFLMGIQKTRIYLYYLEGFVEASSNELQGQINLPDRVQNLGGSISTYSIRIYQLWRFQMNVFP